MKCPVCGGGHKPVHDDVEQTRIRDVINLTGGAGTVTFIPPTGQFWIIDRVVAEVDTGATAALTVYDGAANVANIVSGGVAQSGLGSITGSFNPPIEIGQEGLTLGLTGVAGSLAASDVGVWYRRRFKTSSTPKVDMAFSHTPSDVEAAPSEIGAETFVMPLPVIPMVDVEDRMPGIGDTEIQDPTFR